MEDDQTAKPPAITTFTTASAIPQAPPHPLDGEWFLHADGQTFGPFTGHQLKEFTREGRFSRDTDVVRVGSDSWTKAGDDKTLLALFAPNAPAIQADRPEPPKGDVVAGRGATVVQVTNNIGPDPRRALLLDIGEAKPKSAGTALLLSILLVGLGQCYNGQIGKGVLMFFGCILLWLVMLGWIINIWSWIDAYQTAKAMNERYIRRLAAGVIP